MAALRTRKSDGTVQQKLYRSFDELRLNVAIDSSEDEAEAETTAIKAEPQLSEEERQTRRKQLTGIFSVSSFDFYHRESSEEHSQDEYASQDEDNYNRSVTPPHIAKRRLSGLLNVSAMKAALEVHEHEQMMEKIEANARSRERPAKVCFSSASVTPTCRLACERWSQVTSGNTCSLEFLWRK